MDEAQSTGKAYDPVSDAEVARARLMVGVDVASAARSHVTVATEDAILNFAAACGNDNLLFSDPAAASATRWGGLIAPSIMAGMINKPLRGDPLDPHLLKRTTELFPNCNQFVSGGEWTFYRPIRLGDELYSFEAEDSVEAKPSKFAGRTIHAVRARVKLNQRGEVVAVQKVRRIISPRRGEKSAKIATESALYDGAAIARIDAAYAAPRSSVRALADVQLGQDLSEAVVGPLTVTDVVMFLAAGGFGFAARTPLVGKLAAQDRAIFPNFYGLDVRGVPDVLQRVHWDPALTAKQGHPGPYDYGVMRESYLYLYLADWCGPDGWVVRLHDEMRKFNYVGDTQWISGEVAAIRGNLVVVKLTMRNQRDEETVRAEATVTFGDKVLPEVPADLAARAQKIWQRHLELAR